MKRWKDGVPLLLTLLLVLWTALVYWRSQYGSWHIYPALAVAPVVVAYHLALIARRTPRMPFVLYFATHLVVFIPLWFGCLMLISKDSL